MLKFVIPPMQSDSQPVKYGYYNESVGFRTFRRKADMKNSLNYSVFHRRDVDTPENKAKVYYKRETYLTVDKDTHVIELVDGEWYTRYYFRAGEKIDHLPWKIEKAAVRNRYGSIFYADISKYDQYVTSIERDKSQERPYYTSVEKVWRDMTEAEYREDYVQWRLNVDREIRTPSGYLSYMNPAGQMTVDIRS